MQEFLSVIRSSTLFSGISEQELTGHARLVLARKHRVSRRMRCCCVPAIRRNRSVWCCPGAFWSSRRTSGATAIFCPRQGRDRPFAAAYACAPGSVLKVSVAAETPATVLFLNVKRVLTMCPSACARHSRIIRNLLGELAEKNLRFGEKLTHMGQRTTRAKIMSYLSAEAQRLGTCEFDIPFSRQQLADYLGVERSGLSLELGRMKKDGVLEYRKSHFLLRI